MGKFRDIVAKIRRPKSIGGDIRSVFSMTYSVHNRVASKYKWYDNWHQKPYASKVHVNVLAVVIIATIALITSQFATLNKESLAGKKPSKPRGVISQDMPQNEKISYADLTSAINVEENQLVGTENLKAKLNSNQSYLEFKDGENKYSITTTLLNTDKSKKNPDKTREKIKWKDVQQDVDIENALYENKFKETITVKKKKAETKFSYKIELSGGAKLVQVDGKTLIRDASDKDLVELDSPFAFDDSGARYDYKYSVSGDGLTLEPAVDISGANYPLTIDPTYTIKTSTNTSNFNNYASQRKLARDSNGVLHTVYLRAAGANNVFYAKSNDGGQTWSETQLTTEATYTQYGPALAVDSANNVHLTWGGLDTVNSTYPAVRYIKKTGNSWGSITDILTGSSYPAIAIDSSDNVHVVGTPAGMSTATQYIKYSSGAWGSPYTLHDASGWGIPSIAVDSSNYVHVTYHYTAGGQIVYRLYNGSWQAEENVYTNASYQASNASIALDSNNKPYVVWQQANASYPSNTQIGYTNKVSGSWAAPTWLSADAYNQIQPAISLDASNNVTVVWSGTHAASTTYTQIRAKIYSGGAWGSVTNLTTPGTINNQYASSIWAKYPSTNQPSRPKTGYAFIYMAGSDLSYTASSDLTWDSSPTAPIDLTGTCQKIDRTTNCANGETVRYAVNGVLNAATATTLNGSFTFSAITAPTSGDTITVFIDGVADDLEANAVTKYDGSGSIAMTLYERHLVLGSGDNQTLSSADINKYDNSVSSDEDIYFEVDSSGNLTIPAAATSSYSDQLLYVLAGNTYRPASAGGKIVSTPNLYLPASSTMSCDSNTIKITAGATAVTTTGTLNLDTSTFNYDAGVANANINALTYYNLGVGADGDNASTTTFTLLGATTVTNVVTVGAGTSLSGDVLALSSYVLTLSGSGTPLVLTNLKGTVTAGTGTINYTGSSATSLAATTYYNLDVGTTSDVGASVTYTLLGATTVSNTITVGNAGSTNTDYLSGGSQILTLSASSTTAWNITAKGGFTCATSTVNYLGSSATTVAALTYYSLGVGTTADALAAVTYTLANNISVGGVLTIGNISSTNSDILAASSYTIDFTGSGSVFSISAKGTFTCGTGNVTYNGSSATNIAIATYYNLGVGTTSDSNAGVTYTAGGAITVSNILTIGNAGSTNSDIFSGSSNVITLSGTGTPFVITTKGSFTYATSTIAYTGGTSAVNVTSTTYYNLTVNKASTTYTALGDITVTNVFTITAGTFDASSRTITLSGSGTPFVKTATLTPSTSTFNFTGSSSTTVAGASYYNLGVGTTSDAGTAVTYTLGAATTVSNVLTVGNASSTNTDLLSGSSYVLTLSGSGTPFNITSKGGFTYATSTVTYLGASATTVTGGITYYTLGLGTTSDALAAVTYTLGGDITVANTLTIGNASSTNSDTFAASSYTINFTLVGTPLVITTKGIFTCNTSTVNFNGAGSVIVASATYYHLGFAGASGAKSAAGALTVNGNFTLGGGATFTAGAYTHNFYGNWVVNTTAATPLTATGSTVNFNIPSTPAATSFTGSATNATTFVTVNINNTSGFSISTAGNPTLSPIAATGVVTVAASVTTTNYGTATFSSTLAGSGSWIQQTGSILNLSYASATIITISSFDAHTYNNTVNYSGAAQTCLVTQYYNLTFSGTTTKTCLPTSPILGNVTMGGTTAAWTLTATTTLTINGNLNVNSSSTGSFTQNAYGLTISGNVSVTGGTLTTAGAAFTVTGTTAVSGGTLALANNTGAKTFTKRITVTGGTLNGASTNIIFGEGLTHNTAGSVAITGTVTMSTNAGSIVTDTASSITAVTFNTANNFTTSGAAVLTVGTLTVTSPSTVTNSGLLTNSTSLAGTGTFVNGDGSTGTLTLAYATVPSISTLTTTATGNTVIYTYNGTTSVKATTFYNLTISPTITAAAAYSGAGAITVTHDLNINPTATGTAYALTFTLGGATSVTGITTLTGTTLGTSILDTKAANNYAFTSGTLTINSAGTLNGNNATVTVNGTLTNAGFFNVLNATTTIAGNLTNSGAYSQAGTTNLTVQNGPAATITLGNSVFKNLTINASGSTYTLQDDLDVYGDLTLTAGTLDVNSSNKSVYIAGAWLNNGGTFNPRSGTVNYVDFQSGKTITSNGQAFYNLTINGTNPTFTSSLMHMEGANAGTTFTDENSANTWSASGVSQTSTTQKKFGSSSFKGGTTTSDYITSTNNVSNFQVTTQDFTIDTWVYLNEAVGTQRVIAGEGSGSANWSVTTGHHWILYISNTGTVYFQYNVAGGAGSLTSSSPLTATTWTHVAVVKTGGFIKLYMGGVEKGSVAASTLTVPSAGTPRMVIGNEPSLANSWNGYIDEFRFTKGVGLWNSTPFTPPAVAYSSDQTLSGTTTVSNNLTIAKGSLTVGANNLDVNNIAQTGGTFVASAANTFNIAGNYANSGGTFTDSGGTVTLDGSAAQAFTAGGTGANNDFNNLTVANTAVSGGVTFNDSVTVTGTFKDITPSSIMNFHAGSTYAFTAININGGATGTRIVMHSTSDNTPWIFTVANATLTVSYVDARDSDARTSTRYIDATTGCADSTGNQNWTFISAQSINLAGSLYTSDLGNVAKVPNEPLGVSIGGAAVTTGTTDSNGDYSLPITIADNQMITVFIKGIADKGSIVFKAGVISGDITGVLFNVGYVKLNYLTGTSITNAMLDTASASGDSDMLFSASSGTVTFTQMVNIISAKTYLPGGNIVCNGIDINGTLNLENNTLTDHASWDSSTGTLTTSGSSVVIFDSSSSGKTITSGGQDFDNVTFNNSGGGWSPSDAMYLNGDMTMTAGVLSGTSDISVMGGDVTGNGTIATTDGTFMVDGVGNFGGTTNWSFNNLTFGDGSDVAATTKISTNQITATGVLTIATLQTLDAGDDTWNLPGAGTTFVPTGTFTQNASTFVYNSASSENITGSTYYNLQVNHGSTIFTVAGGTTVTNVLTVSAGTLDGSSQTIILSGGGTPFVNSGAFTASTSTVKYTGVGTVMVAPVTYYNIETAADSVPGNDSYTKLLLHQDGTNGSTAFTDSEPTPKTVSANGSAQISTAQSKFGGASGLYNGSSDYLSAPDSADWSLGTGDFTIDTQAYFSTTSSPHNSIPIASYGYMAVPSVGNQLHWLIYLSNANTLTFYRISGTSETYKSVSWSPSPTTWYHIAIVRSGNNLKFFIDGIQQGTDQDVTGVSYDNGGQSGDNLYVGYFRSYLGGGLVQLFPWLSR
ncbi:MAG: LamG-like jellyroll fold domain-containing protein [Candidatus Berkelbacteria bacterium]